MRRSERRARKLASEPTLLVQPREFLLGRGLLVLDRLCGDLDGRLVLVVERVHESFALEILVSVRSGFNPLERQADEASVKQAQISWRPI